MEDGYIINRRLQFVSNYEWIWNIKLTRLFVDNHLLKIPQEWRDSLFQWESQGVNSVTVDEFSSTASLPTAAQSLREYIAQCEELSLPQMIPKYVTTNEIKVDNNISRGMSPKKLHEVSRLAGLVKQVCQDTQCDSVIDVGSGLGYIGTCLISQCGLRVMCIEQNEQRINSANIREKKLLGSCDSHMTTVSMSIDSSADSRATVTKLIESLSVPSVSLVGLHCCGDLTPTLLSLIVTPPHLSLTSAVIVPCCYHKMSTINEQTITNFPLSQCYKREMSCGQFVPFNTFALRLAAQEPLVSWQSLSAEGHHEHMKRVVYRAVLETLLVETGEALSGKMHRKANYENFEEYFKSLSDEIKGFTLEDAMKQYNKFSHLFPLIEPFTALQYYMQRILETVVLTDQAEYLKENGQLTVDLVPVFDVEISPRCFAIVAKTKC